MARTRKRRNFVHSETSDNQPVQAQKPAELEIINTSILLALQIVKALTQK